MNARPQWAHASRGARGSVRRLQAGLRVLGVALWKVRWPLFVLVAALLGGTLLFWLNGTYANPLQSLFYVLNLITLQAGPEDLPRPAELQLISGVIVVAGVVSLAGGAASVIQLMGDPKERQLALASTFSGHIVVCGIGRVGYRVINELLEMGEPIVGVNQSENEEWLGALQKAGVPVIIGDARRKQTLIDAGVERAAAIIACTSDELTNLDVALDARELNPNVKVVLRMFDAKLAQNVSKGFNIQTVFSVSALAAPAFAAAATRARVDYSFKLEGHVLNVSTITFEPGSRFIGKTPGQIEDEVRCAIIGASEGGEMRMRVDRGRAVRPGERYYVVADLAGLKALNNGQ